MITGKLRFSTMFGASLMALCISSPAMAENDTSDNADNNTEENEGRDDNVIIVTGQAQTYNSNSASEEMIQLQTPLTSPLSAIKNLPGVSVNEGDSLGFDDWSTAVALRGFQSNLSEQQVGMTIDGLPNGGSNYGGGAKANRYIDSMNLGTVEVSQGTADIGSLSNEALGGTLNFTTADPEMNRRIRGSVSVGQNKALRGYMRYDTGDLGGVRGWVSASHQEASDWINQSAQNWRDHFAAKFVTDGNIRFSGYFSYDDTHEDNYDQVYSAQQFASYPNSDGLADIWTGVPQLDQNYRRGWSTLRTNIFGYLKMDAEFDNGIELNAAAYYHNNKGRGDWIPPYVVDVTNDGVGNPQSELSASSPVQGGAFLGQTRYINGNNVALSVINAHCLNGNNEPLAGSAGDPSCYAAGAIPVMSYRHTHYKKDRYGFTANASWNADFGEAENTLRAGLWYEGGKRKEWRDWHKVKNALTGPEFNEIPYWTQYSYEFPQNTFKWFVEDTLKYGPVTASFGIKQFINSVDRQDLFDSSTNDDLNSTSRILFSGGVTFAVNDNIELFAGYAENFKALTDRQLETSGASREGLEPETTENIEAGVRFNNGILRASAAYFNANFDNRVAFISAQLAGDDNAPDYLGEGNGRYLNVGGISSEGFELLASVEPVRGLTLYASYTYIDAKYLGAKDGSAADNAFLNGVAGLIPGNRVTGIAENMFALSANWTDGVFRAGLSGKYTGDRFVDIGNQWKADSNIVADMHMGVKGEAISDSLKALDLSMVVNNVFAESYLGGIAGGAAWIGAPRSVVFTLTADF